MGPVESNTEMSIEVRNGNLHVRLQGAFGIDTAMILTSHISRRYREGSNVFIHTSGVTTVSPQSREMFQTMLGVYNLPVKHIYLMGEKGFKICHDGGRVIVRNTSGSRKKCGNSCKNCR
ncbi:MAG: hypothetical protein CSA20_04155 [Deltaproteobacteria bacterium]|nr:MAG: hypothetical protein CSA20_04155 [Deltaproteobacteria bacterium]